MLPVVHIFGIHVPMYGLMTVLGVIAYFVTYYFLVEKEEKLDRLNSNRLLFVSFVGIAALYIFAWLFNALYLTVEYRTPTFGGITWLGGVLGSFPIMLFLIHKIVPKAKGNAIHYFSLIIPGIVIGHALGRVGCFFGGCCYGKVTYGPFGVTFPGGSIAQITHPGANGRSEPVFPTQLFEAAFELILFVLMIVLRKKYSDYNLPGYCLAYGVFRFIIEFMRGDDRGSLILISPAQWNSIILIVCGVLIILFKKGYVFKKLAKKCEVWQAEAVKEAEENAEISHKGETSDAKKLRELYKLRRDEIITEEEYLSKKEEILKRM